MLRVGLDPTYPPFETRDAAGNLTGVSVDLARAIGENMGRPVEFVPTDFAGLIAALQTRKIDMILSSMTETPERARQVAFSKPYVETGLCLLVPSASPVTTIGELDAPGKTVVVRTGTTGHIHATRNLRNARVIPQELAEACVNEVLNGNVDAFLYDQLSVLEYAARHPDRLKAIARPFQKESWAVAVHRDDSELLSGINRALENLPAKDGPLTGAFARYPVLEQRRRQLEELGQPFIFVTPAAGGH